MKFSLLSVSALALLAQHVMALPAYEEVASVVEVEDTPSPSPCTSSAVEAEVEETPSPSPAYDEVVPEEDSSSPSPCTSAVVEAESEVPAYEGEPVYEGDVEPVPDEEVEAVDESLPYEGEEYVEPSAETPCDETVEGEEDVVPFEEGVEEETPCEDEPEWDVEPFEEDPDCDEWEYEDVTPEESVLPDSEEATPCDETPSAVEDFEEEGTPSVLPEEETIDIPVYPASTPAVSDYVEPGYEGVQNAYLSSDESSGSSGLSTGAIAGLCVAGVAVVGALVGAAVMVQRKKKSVSSV